MHLVSEGTARTRKPLECPHCASAVLEVVRVEFELRGALAVRCKECGASGRPSHTADPQHAVSAWNQRMGRLSLVKG